MYDAFLSHASEDKAAFVDSLAAALRERGLKIWYDESDLVVGNSVRRTIDEGLTKSSFGIAVLSPSFFEKEWAQVELDALFDLQIAKKIEVLPVLHRISHEDVLDRAPTISVQKALLSSDGVEDVADKLAAEIQKRAGRKEAPFRGVMLDSVIELLALPRGVDNVLRGFRFTNCDVVGPGFLALASDDNTFGDNAFKPLALPPLPEVLRAVPIAQCRFDFCRFIDVGLVALTK